MGLASNGALILIRQRWRAPMIHPSLPSFSFLSYLIGGMSDCLRLARGAGPCHCGRHSHPPNPAHAETCAFPSGDGETQCSKVRSGEVLDGPSLRSQAATEPCGLPIARAPGDHPPPSPLWVCAFGEQRRSTSPYALRSLTWLSGPAYSQTLAVPRCSAKRNGMARELELNVRPIFSTPLLVFSIPEAEQINAELKRASA